MDNFPPPAAAIAHAFINTLQDAQLASLPPSASRSTSSSTASSSSPLHHHRRTDRDFAPFYQSPQELITTATLREFHTGNGEAITKLICKEILSARHEILFVTGFWAKSSSRGYINLTLRELNRIHSSSSSSSSSSTRARLRVRIGFSSTSLSQKLFQTSSTKGKIWSSNTWSKKLGLPNPEEIPNIDLQVKSVFFRPVSLLHGKFCVVDGRKLLLPSANVSWEDWLEGCGVYEGGGIIGCFTRFWEAVWGGDGGDDRALQAVSTQEGGGDYGVPAAVETDDDGWPMYLQPKPRLITAPLPSSSSFSTTDTAIPAIFLPHPHHSSLPPVFPLAHLPDVIYRFIAAVLATLRIFPHKPPRDEHSYLSNPQNAFWITAIDSAKESIYLHTPNITAKPVIDAMLRALGRGVNVEIVTSKKMMVLEQLVTAGNTTERCIKRFLKKAKKLGGGGSGGAGAGIGACWVYWYDPNVTPVDDNYTSMEAQNVIKANKSHVKCLIVDEQVVVLGSGNMDRASWVTSQEVNVGFFPGKEGAKAIRAALVGGVANRFVRDERSTGMDDAAWMAMGGAPGQTRQRWLLYDEPRRRLETV